MTCLKLIQPEADFHVDLHRHRLTVFHGGLEFPGLYRFNRFLIQTQSEAAGYANISRLAVGADHQPKDAGALVFRLTGFFRVLRIGLENHPRSADAAAYMEKSTTNSAAATLTNAGPSSNTHATA